MNNDLLTLREAYELLDGHVSLSTLYLAVQSKKLPHYRVSGNGRRGKVLVRRAELLAWLEAQKVGETR